MSYIDKLPRPFFVLAPMYDVTDTVFRQVIADLQPPDLFFTEFVNVDGLQSDGRSKIIHRLKFTKHEKPIVAQIWGKQPENYLQTAQELVEMGFDGIDINMGCPDKSVIKNGCCSALINNHDLAKEIIEATKQGAAGKVPISVKTRIGFRSFDEHWLKFLLEQNVSMLSVHLRTVREMSKVPAHWELMKPIRKLRDEISPQTLLVGNGDVMNCNQAEALAKENQIDGVMIGRGIFKDPFAFNNKGRWQKLGVSKKLEIYKNHVELFTKTWKNDEYPVIVLNKFCKIYVNDFDGAKEMREHLMASKSIGELQNNLQLLQKQVKI